jgi:hypothetical protein
MLARLSNSLRLLSMRRAKPPIMKSLAAFISASVGPSATKRRSTSRETWTACAAWSGRVCSPRVKAPACMPGAK